MTLKIGIIGGGWYGCHIGTSLLSLGFEIKIFEAGSRLLNRASANNQFRLHQGFHYARHYRTRQQSRDGFLRFTERYPTLSKQVENNFYAIPEFKSLIDYDTYKLIMVSSGLTFKEVNAEGFANVSGIINTEERVLMITEARRYFERLLEGRIALGEKVADIKQVGNTISANGEVFDYLIDASWGALANSIQNFYYEPTLLLYYEGVSKAPAVTMVDGPLCSVYPTEDAGLFTLSSVPYTPLANCSSYNQANEIMAHVDQAQVKSKQAQMEVQISEFLPHFKDMYKYVGVQLSIKTKPVGLSDDRSCYVSKDRRLISVMSGKIDNVFYATERILGLISSLELDPTFSGISDVRKDILRK